MQLQILLFRQLQVLQHCINLTPWEPVARIKFLGALQGPKWAGLLGTNIDRGSQRGHMNRDRPDKAATRTTATAPGLRSCYLGSAYREPATVLSVVALNGP